MVLPKQIRNPLPMPEKNAVRSGKVACERTTIRGSFSAIWLRPLKQGVEQVRGIDENYYAAVHSAIMPLPWLTDVSERLQSYLEQHFANGFDYALELSQGKDFQEFALINTRWLQKSVESLLAQAKDFTETYVLPAKGEKAPTTSSLASE